MKKILLIDDEVNILKIFSLILTKNGFEVDTANTIEEALNLVNDTYDFILVDYYMYNGNTLDFIKNLLVNLDSNKVCVISGTEDKTDVKKLTKIGVTNFLKKPISYDKIIDMINGNF